MKGLGPSSRAFDDESAVKTLETEGDSVLVVDEGCDPETVDSSFPTAPFPTEAVSPPVFARPVADSAGRSSPTLRGSARKAC